MFQFVMLGLLTALCVWAFTQEDIFQRVRWALNRWHNRSGPVVQFIVQGMSCDYCFAHWVGAALILLVQPAPLAGFTPLWGTVIGWAVTVLTSALWTSSYRVLRRVGANIGATKVVALTGGGSEPVLFDVVEERIKREQLLAASVPQGVEGRVKR